MKWLIKALFKVTKLFINGILLPIDLIINSLFPDLEYVISHVTAFLNWLVDFVHWVMSWLPFSSTFYSILVAYVYYIKYPDNNFIRILSIERNNYEHKI